jgi:hypothetical protein
MATSRLLSLDDAAEACGTTRKALARRADRGTLQTVLRNGRRWVLRAELERVSLLTPNNPARGSTAPTTPEPGLEKVLERLEILAAENGKLRLLEAEAGAEREARERLEQELFEMRSWREQIKSASWLQRRRLLRDADSRASAPTN